MHPLAEFWNHEKLLLSRQAAHLATIAADDAPYSTAAHDWANLLLYLERNNELDAGAGTPVPSTELRAKLSSQCEEVVRQLQTSIRTFDPGALCVLISHANIWDNETKTVAESVGNFPRHSDLVGQLCATAESHPNARVPGWDDVAAILRLASQWDVCNGLVELIPDARAPAITNSFELALQGYVSGHSWMRGSWYPQHATQYALAIADSFDDRLRSAIGFGISDLLRLRDWYQYRVSAAWYELCRAKGDWDPLGHQPVDIVACWTFDPVNFESIPETHPHALHSLIDFLRRPVEGWYWSAPKIVPLTSIGTLAAIPWKGLLASELVPLVDYLAHESKSGNDYYRARASVVDREVEQSLQRLLPGSIVTRSVTISNQASPSGLECDVLALWQDVAVLVEGKGIALAHKLGPGGAGRVRRQLVRVLERAADQLDARSEILYQGCHDRDGAIDVRSGSLKEILRVVVPLGDMGLLSTRVDNWADPTRRHGSQDHIVIVPYEIWEILPFVLPHPDMFLSYLWYKQYVGTRPWATFADEWEVLGAYINNKTVPRLDPSSRDTRDSTVMLQNYQEDFNAYYRHRVMEGRVDIPLPKYLTPRLPRVVGDFLDTLRSTRPPGWLNAAAGVWLSSYDLKTSLEERAFQGIASGSWTHMLEMGEQFVQFLGPDADLGRVARSNRVQRAMTHKRVGFFARQEYGRTRLEWAWSRYGYPARVDRSGRLQVPDE